MTDDRPVAREWTTARAGNTVLRLSCGQWYVLVMPSRSDRRMARRIARGEARVRAMAKRADHWSHHGASPP